LPEFIFGYYIALPVTLKGKIKNVAFHVVRLMS
jgi:hypothetical protein